MPFRPRSIRGGSIVLIRATGPAAAADWERLPLLLPSSSQVALLVDLRRRETLPDKGVVERATMGLTMVAGTVSAAALIANPGAQFGCARIVDAVASLRAIPVAAFTEKREAFDWLVERLPE